MDDRFGDFSVCAEQAPKLVEWLTKRAGVVLWRSQDLGNPGRTWWTPYLTETGDPFGPPHWSAGDPQRITDANKIGVYRAEQLHEMAVALRRKGTMLVLTDGSQRRVKKKLAALREQHGPEIDFECNGIAERSVSFMRYVTLGSLAEVQVDQSIATAAHD